jgi:subtilase family serine protease
MHKRAITAAMITGTTVLASALAVTGTASAAPATKAVPNSKPAWTAHATRLGQAKQTAKVHARVYLEPDGGMAALERTANALSTPGSTTYHDFLTAAQYHAQFDATAASVKSVSTFLRSSGLKVAGVAAHNRYVTVSGSVKAAEKAFGTTLTNYKRAGATVQAPSTALKLPTTVATNVLTITGLDTSAHLSTPATKQDAPPPAGFRNARPCSTYFGQLKASDQADFSTKLPKFQGKTLTYAPCGYTGPQLRSAYEGDTTLTGKGITVGIVDAYAAPTIAADTNTYAENHGDGSYVKGQLTQVVPASFTHQKACGGAPGWYGEETLDVEAVHAMAPDADIRYYGGKSCYDADLTDTLQKVVNQDKVQLVSNSYGDSGEEVPADEVASSEAVFLQGTTEGISFLFSSGDDGDELAATGIKSADYEASDPYVTAVGGTSTAIGAAGQIKFQSGWGTDKYSLSADGKSWTAAGFLYGSGGGASTLFNQPAYQAGLTKSAVRQVPDVAMDADPNTGMLIGETQTFSDGAYYDEYRIGGTSLASPLFAGLTALSLQNSGSTTGAGLLNNLIYKDAATDFTDVKKTPNKLGDVRVDYVNGENAKDGLLYSVRTFGDDSSLAVTKGYDQVTGVGVPNTGWLTAIPGTTSS